MGFEESEILKASGKTGEGVEGILKAVIERLPAYAAFRCSAGFTRASLYPPLTHRAHQTVGRPREAAQGAPLRELVRPVPRGGVPRQHPRRRAQEGYPSNPHLDHATLPPKRLPLPLPSVLSVAHT